ncbi:MAG TPA: hypothetical protein PKM97_07185 [Bacteroidia bacterium]|nr:hypothetical protein [Bacteroidia bacterium]
MIRKVIEIFIYVCIIFFVVSGIYFYHRSFKENKVLPEAQPSIEPELIGPVVPLFRKEYDLENDEAAENTGLISNTKACSGQKSCELNAEREFGLTFLYPIESIQGGVGLTNLKLNAAIWTIDPGEAQWVLEIMDPQNQSVFWNSEPIAMRKLQWDTLEFFFDLPQNLMKQGYVIKVYPWNKNFKQIWIDNISVTILGRSTNDKKDLMEFKQVNYFFDFETSKGLSGDPALSEDYSHSGKKSALLNGSNSYSPSVIKILSDVSSDTLSVVTASVWLYPKENNVDAVLAFSIDDVNGVNKFWSGKSTGKMELVPNKWQKLNASFGIPEENRKALMSDDKLTIYVWNRSRMKLYADDLEIVYGEEGDRPGQYPFADMNLSTRNSYSFDRSHPPFRISYIPLIDLKNDRSPFLVVDSHSKQAELFPQQEAISIKSGSNKTDILLTYSDGTFEFLKWCTTQHKFYLAGRTAKLPFDDKDVQILAIDIDGDQVSEVLAIQDSEARLFKFSSEALSECLNNKSELSLQVIWHGNVDLNALSVIDNFDSDSKQEWFSVEKNSSSWSIRKFVDGNIKTISSGKFPGKVISNKTDILCGKFLSPITNVQILINGSNDQEPALAVYDYISSTLNFKIRTTNRTTDLSSIFKPGRKMFKLKSVNNLQDDILLIDLSNKFNMHIIKTDKQGFFVHSQSEFIGYAGDHNPKFYEFIKPIPGNFISPLENNLILVLRNCADEIFDGKNCNSFGGVSDLPDQVQMYSLKFD